MNNCIETDFENFSIKVRNAIEKHFGEEYNVSLKTVNKNNGLIMHGLTIMKKSESVCPNIYLEKFYEEYSNGKTFNSIVNELILIFRDSDSIKPNELDFFCEYEKVKDRLLIKLINKEMNEQLLKGVPHREFIDMAIVCMVEIQMPGGNTGSVLIHNNHICMWGIHEQQLIEDAIYNTMSRNDTVIMRMEDMISKIYGQMNDEQFDTVADREMECPCGLYVVSNEKQLYGASAIIFPEVRSRLAKTAGGDFYVIPSSIHELIIIPSNIGGDIGGLNDIINEVNSTMVSQDEILSNHAYLYDSSSDSFQQLETN